MKNELHFTPTKISLGSGNIRFIADYILPFGKVVGIITTQSAIRNDYLDKITVHLNNAGIEHYLIAKVKANPTSTDITNIVIKTKLRHVNVLVAVGGGSVIDATKAASVAILSSSIDDILGKNLPSDARCLPVIAVPTTCGTGAEVTKGAIIYDVKTGIKSGVRGEAIYPKAAIIDPDFLTTIPNNILGPCVFDTFTHAFETFIANKSSILSRIFSIYILTTLFKLLKNGMPNVAEQSIREQLSLIGLLGGINVAMVGSCLPHRMQHAMASVKHTHCSHGEGLAAIYMAWIWHCQNYECQSFLKIAHIFEQENMQSTVYWIQKQLQLKNNLLDLGYHKNDIPIFVENITGDLSNDPIPNISAHLISRLYHESL